MKKIFLCLGILAIMFFCSSSYKPSNYVKIADKITAKTAAKIEKEKDLILIGTGGGMMDDIKIMSMGFHYYKEVDLDIARELFVYCLEEYLSAINSNEEVKPYLHNYPFTAQNIEIIICFYKTNGSDVSIGKIYSAFAKEGKITYYMDGPEKKALIVFYKETYEDAMKFVKSKNDKNQYKTIQIN